MAQGAEKEFVRWDDFHKEHRKMENKFDRKIEHINHEMSSMKEIVLPLAVNMENISKNTEEMKEAFKEFTKEQKESNKIIQQHTTDIITLKENTQVRVENAKGKWNVYSIIATSVFGGTGLLLAIGKPLAEFFFGK